MATERRKKPKRKRSPKQAASELAIESRREKVTKLRLAAWSIRDIAAHLKCSVGTVHSDISEVYARTVDKSDGAIERDRALSLDRLDAATRGIWHGIESGDLDAVDRLTKLEARRAKLLGLDAANKVEHSGPEGAPIPVDATTALLERLTGLVAGEAAGAAAQGDPGEANSTGDGST